MKENEVNYLLINFDRFLIYLSKTYEWIYQKKKILFLHLSRFVIIGATDYITCTLASDKDTLVASSSRTKASG